MNDMNILVVGASGATARELVKQFLHHMHKVKVIVRTPEKLPKTWKTNNDLQIIAASLSDLTDAEMNDIVND